MSIVLASYNIHRCYGSDDRYDPERIRQVLRDIGGHITALQEVELLHDAPGLLDYFCEDSEWQAIPGLTMTRDAGHYGNALLTSLPIFDVQRIDLSLPGREPRGALHVTLEYQDAPLTVIATHLGLQPGERRMQINRLLDLLQHADTSGTTVLMGDLNEWLPWGRPLRWLRKHFEHYSALPSYPARYPMLALDRICVTPAEQLTDLTTVNNEITRVASDHLPLVATMSEDRRDKDE